VSTPSPGEPEPAVIVEPGPIAVPGSVVEPAVIVVLGSIVEPAASQRPSGGPVLPEQSREDTDAGWGEYPATDDERSNERLYQDRPPHWDNF
jgi:hypothetical protein